VSSVDVGDALELTFNTAPGAAVVVSWFDPMGVAVIDQAEVAEQPAASGAYPMTFLPTSAGVWSALFTASGSTQAVERYYVRANSVTGLPPLATVGEVGNQYGSMTPAQEGLASWLVRAASKMIRFRYPQVDAQIASGLLDGDVVALVVANMVLRVLRNPGGLRAETTGPFSRSYDTSVAAGLLGLSAEELTMLTPTQLQGWAPASTIRLRPGLAPPPCGVRRARW
jgi:hypothetical protein